MPFLFILLLSCILPPQLRAESEYIALSSQVSQADAAQQCVDEGGVIASFHSDHDFEAVSQLCETQCKDERRGCGCWTGLKDTITENVWFNEDGTDPDYLLNADGSPKTGIYPWYTRRPNDRRSGQDCVQLVKKFSFELNDIACTDLNYPICSVPSPQYFTLSTKLSQSAAEQQCIDEGGVIASFHSDTAFAAASQLCETLCADEDGSNSDCGCWTGLTDSGTENVWSNADGSSADYLLNADGSPKTGVYPWWSGEPNDWGSGEDCVHIWKAQSFYLNDIGCSDLNYAICEQVTEAPSADPTSLPSADPTGGPTSDPTLPPSPDPSTSPTEMPTPAPSTSPTKIPTPAPSTSPTNMPTPAPSTQGPSPSPTKMPTPAPSTSPIRYVSQYFALTSKRSQEAASWECQNQQGTIASFHSDSDYEIASALCEATCNAQDPSNGGCACWTGIRDDGTENVWYNEDGSAKDYLMNSFGAPNTGQYPWHSGEPNDWGSREDCVHIWKAQGYDLNDAPCSDSFYAICEQIVPYVPEYFALTSKKSQAAASLECQNQQGTIASFHSDSDYETASALCEATCVAQDPSNGGCACWTGIRDDGTENVWYNEDGSAKDYLMNSFGAPNTGQYPWHSGEPNDSGSREDCVHIWKAQSYDLNDAPCSESFYAICEREARYRAASAGSMFDLFDGFKDEVNNQTYWLLALVALSVALFVSCLALTYVNFCKAGVNHKYSKVVMMSSDTEFDVEK